MPLNTIVLTPNPKGQFIQGEADGAVSPGMNAKLDSDGNYTAGGSGGRHVEALVAIEDGLQGKTVDDAYADGDAMQMYRPLPGDRLQVLVKSGENLGIDDALTLEPASGLWIEPLSSADEQELLLTKFKVHDAMATDLPAAAANDDMGLVTGTPGTDAPTLQGVDFGGTSTDEKAAIELTLPPDYVPGGAITVRLHAGMLTTISDGDAEVDVEAWKATDAGAVGSDLVATDAQDINSLTFDDFDFTITPTDLVPGDKLIVRLSFSGSDTGDAGVMIPEISRAQILLETAGDGIWKVVESTGGALAANTLVKARYVG